MNILHMKYAVEVAKVGSLNKAAESLYVTLPNISRSIKELEADLGITVFDRTAKGMVLTPEGEEFISYAKDMEALAKYIKETSEGAKVVFIGPCTAKNAEAQLESVKPYVDSVLTFEELQALFDSKDIDITTLSEDVLDNASYFGRIFARSGGLSDAVVQAMKEQDIEFDLKPAVCDGIEACRMALLKKSKNVLDANFIEGMACVGGCIGGAGCLTHGEKNKSEVDKYGREAMEKTISDAVSILKIKNHISTPILPKAPSDYTRCFCFSA